MEPSNFNIYSTYGLDINLNTMLENIDPDFFTKIMDKSFVEIIKEDITKGKRKYLLIG